MSLQEFHSVVNEFFDDQGWSTIATLIKTTSVYDLATSENIVTEKRYSVQAMPFDYIKKNEGDGQMNNSLIRTGDRQVYLKPIANVTTIDPTKDKLQMGTKIYDIIVVKDFNPTMIETLYWELYVRI